MSDSIPRLKDPVPLYALFWSIFCNGMCVTFSFYYHHASSKGPCARGLLNQPHTSSLLVESIAETSCENFMFVLQVQYLLTSLLATLVTVSAEVQVKEYLGTPYPVRLIGKLRLQCPVSWKAGDRMPQTQMCSPSSSYTRMASSMPVVLSDILGPSRTNFPSVNTDELSFMIFKMHRMTWSIRCWRLMRVHIGGRPLRTTPLSLQSIINRQGLHQVRIVGSPRSCVQMNNLIG